MEPWVIRLHIRICNTYTCKRDKVILSHLSPQKRRAISVVLINDLLCCHGRFPGQCWTPDTHGTIVSTTYVCMICIVQVQALRAYYLCMYIRIHVIYQYTHVYIFWENHGLDSSLCPQQPISVMINPCLRLPLIGVRQAWMKKRFRQSQRAAAFDKCR